MTLARKSVFLLLSAVLLGTALLAGCATAPKSVSTASSAKVATGTPEPASQPEEAEGPGSAPPPPAAAATLPFNPLVTRGKLENGLTYYIRQNSRPEKRAELWLVLNAGSMQEDDDQRGLAHFVEHMAFNGTEQFAKQEIVDYLESIGMRFGPDINAYTSFDETVYMLMVPTDDPAIVETAMRILREWAQAVSFEGLEIDKERGVVVEEWRSGRGAGARMRDRQWPILFKDSRYAERLVIGDKQTLESAPHDALRRFYADWYRPDLMAVIAVGDFDQPQIEALIKKHFSDLRNPETPREREIYPVPDHDETLFAIVTDPEATSTQVAVYYKLDKRPDGTQADYRRNLVEALYHGMVNARLDEIRQQPDPPFLFALSSSGGFVRSRDVYFQAAGVKEGGLERGLDALLVEVERVDRHGFSASELERVKKELLRGYEQAYRERDKQRSSSWARECQRHFLAGEPMPGIEFELELARKLVPTISLEEVNHLAREWISERNRVVTVSAPEKQGAAAPTEQALLAVFEAAVGKTIGAYVDQVREEPLVADKPQPGTVVEQSTVGEVGVTHWKLSNGVEVVLKPTDFKNDEVLLSGFSPGGHSLVPDGQHTSASFASAVLRVAGLGQFNQIELDKALAGKVVRASAYVGELEEGVGADASPEDLETMFELLYLLFTGPRMDAEAFQSWLVRTKGFIENRLARPETVFRDKMGVTLSQGHHRRRPISAELLEEIDLQAAFEIYGERFEDASDFTFILVGNFQPDVIRPLVLTYLGGLHSSGREETWRDVGARPPEGVNRVEVRKGLEPKSRVQITFTGKAEWSRQNHHDISSLAHALRIRLREILREDMGGTYGVGVFGNIARRPTPGYSFNVSFGCAPENVDELIEAVFDEIAAVKENGVEDSYVAKVKEAQLRDRETALRENSFWRGVLANYYRYGTDPRLILAYDELVATVSSERVQAAARRYLDTERYVQGVLYPEDADEASH